MKLIDRSQAFLQNLRVDLGCGNVRVSKHQLDRSEIGTPLKQVRSKRMPDKMRLELDWDLGLSAVPGDDLPESLPGQSFTSSANEEKVRLLAFQELGPGCAEILFQSLNC